MRCRKDVCPERLIGNVVFLVVKIVGDGFLDPLLEVPVLLPPVSSRYVSSETVLDMKFGLLIRLGQSVIQEGLLQKGCCTQ